MPEFRRLIAREMAALLVAVISLVAGVGYLALALKDDLHVRVRDAVWEASVPPTYVYGTIAAQSGIHLAVQAALIGGNGEAARTRVLELEAEAQKSWGELMALSPHFPADVKAAVEATHAALGAFRAAYGETLDALNSGGNARSLFEGRQSATLAELDASAKSTRAVMAARIQSVNELMEQSAASGMLRMGVALGITALLLLLAAGLVHRRLLRPVHALDTAMRALAGGNLDQKLPDSKRREEMRSMRDSVHRVRDGLLEARR